LFLLLFESKTKTCVDHARGSERLRGFRIDFQTPFPIGLFSPNTNRVQKVSNRPYAFYVNTYKSSIVKSVLSVVPWNTSTRFEILSVRQIVRRSKEKWGEYVIRSTSNKVRCTDCDVKKTTPRWPVGGGGSNFKTAQTAIDFRGPDRCARTKPKKGRRGGRRPMCSTSAATGRNRSRRCWRQWRRDA
jgi:hypothetical protein